MTTPEKIMENIRAELREMNINFKKIKDNHLPHIEDRLKCVEDNQTDLKHTLKEHSRKLDELLSRK